MEKWQHLPTGFPYLVEGCPGGGQTVSGCSTFCGTRESAQEERWRKVSGVMSVPATSKLGRGDVEWGVTTSDTPPYLLLSHSGSLIYFHHISHLCLKFSYLFIQLPTVNCLFFTPPTRTLATQAPGPISLVHHSFPRPEKSARCKADRQETLVE